METKEKKKSTAKAVAKPEVKKDTWEYKDRNYYLLGNKNPLTYTLPSKHNSRYPLVWFDPEKGYERELRYATNQKSIFVDEQKGQVTLKHIVFENGHLMVPKEKRNLQEFLHRHPHANLIFAEYDRIEEAKDDVQDLELELIAMNAAMDMDVDFAEAILRVEVGSSVSKLSSKELKRDLLLFAKRNPQLFIDLANDENVQLRNFAIVATESNIIKLSSDNRTFTWASNDRKLMNVPFDENPYSAMAAWLTPYEFNKIATQVQLEIFEKFFEDYNQYIRMPKTSVEFASRMDHIREEFQVFEKNANASNHAANVYTQPTDLHRFGSASWNKGKNSPPIEVVSNRNYNQLKLSPLTQPTNDFPVAKYSDNKLTVFPNPSAHANADVTFNYIRKPADVVWAYTVNPTLGNYIFNDTPGGGASVIPTTGFQDFEISESQQTEVIIAILKYAGVVIRDPQIVQAASSELAQTEANTKR